MEWTEEEQEYIDDSYYEEDVFIAAVECDISFYDVEECYEGEFRSDEEFVENLLDSMGELNVPSYVHIDWEATARDIMMGYVENDGHYFRMM